MPWWCGTAAGICGCSARAANRADHILQPKDVSWDTCVGTVSFYRAMQYRGGLTLALVIAMQCLQAGLAPSFSTESYHEIMRLLALAKACSHVFQCRVALAPALVSAVRSGWGLHFGRHL